MNVALVHHYRLEPGGLTTMITRLRQGLRARGHETLILTAGDTADVTPLGDPGVYGMYLRRMRQEGAILKPLTGFLARLPPTLRRLSAFFARERIDIVHVHFAVPASLYFAVLRPWSRWKLVVTFHGTDGYALTRRTWWYRALVRLALSRADIVTAVSGDLLGAVTRAFPHLKGRSRVILNCNPITEPPPEVMAAPLPAGTPERYVLAVGSLIPRKGYDLLIRAARLARERGHRLDLLIVGTGPDADTLTSLVRELGLEDSVRLFGEVPHAVVKRLYAGATFFVHAAREEAFGLVLLEAMACRKAVIAPRVGGIPEFVRHGESGLLVEPESPEALAEAMIRLSEDADLRESLARRAYDFVTREHTWERLVDHYVAAYEAARRGGVA